MLKRKFIKSIIFIGSALSSGMATSGEAKKLKIIVPFSAGGVVDRLVRMIAERLSQSGKYHAYVVNKPGAGGVKNVPFCNLTVRLQAVRYTVALSSSA